MELRHLRYFVAVAEEENVSRAARKLHVSQPGLSRQVRDLEDEIGFALLERTAKSVKLTEAGTVFLTGARAVLQHTAEVVSRARAIADGTSGEIAVGYAPSLTVQILPQALRKFQETFPHLRVALHDLSTAEMLAQVMAGKLQVALTVRQPARSLRGLGLVELARYVVCVAVANGHLLARSKSVRLEQIAHEPVIAFSRKDYPEHHEQLEQLFAPLGVKPRIVGEHDSVSSLIAAVESGRGLAIVSSGVACMAGPRLKLLPLRPAPPPVSVVAIWRKETETEAVQNFVAAAGPDSAGFPGRPARRDTGQGIVVMGMGRP
jgi:DNA-binding transcriptional LysR family regulator